MSSSAVPTFVPALAPPHGVQSNPDHPDSLAYLSHITVGVCLPFVTLFFFLRSYVRIFVKRTWVLEDWLCFVSWGGTVAYCGILLSTMDHHGGQHLWDITKTQASEVSYWFWIASIEYGVMICMTKISVLTLYRRVFAGQKRSLFDIEALVLIAILIGFYVSTSLVKIFECTPHARITNKAIPGTCVDVSALLNTSGLFNTITDFLILLMPAQALWGLKMNFKRKVLIMLVFTFGLCAPVFSAIGFAVRLQISGNTDTSWNQPEILLWGAAELATGNLCVCFPEFGVFFKRETYKRNVKPTASVLGSAKAAIQRSKRATSHLREMSSDAMELTAGSRRWESLDDDFEQSYARSPEISAAPLKRDVRNLPANSVRVDFEVRVESAHVRDKGHA